MKKLRNSVVGTSEIYHADIEAESRTVLRRDQPLSSHHPFARVTPTHKGS